MLQALNDLGFKDVVLHHDVVNVAVVGATLIVVHLHIAQLHLGLGQTGRGRVVADVAVLQVVNPLFEGSGGHLVELVDADDVIFGEDVGR